jgi:hypothetical protein
MGAGGAEVIGPGNLAKYFGNSGMGRQAQERTIATQQAMAAPSPPMGGLFGRIEARQQDLLIQFDEGRVRKLGAGLGPRAAGHPARVILRPALMEKGVQVALDGLTGFLKQQKHDARECQKPLASKVGGPNAMTRTEIRGENPGADLLDEMKPTLRWRSR